MKSTNAQAFISFCQDNGIQHAEFFGYASAPEFGYLHFREGGYAPQALPLKTVDGIYVGNDYCLSRFCENQSVTKAKANKFCENNGVEMPGYSVRDNIVSHRTELNAILKTLGWPELLHEDYWSVYDQASYSYTVPGINLPDYFDPYGSGISIPDEYVTDDYTHPVYGVFKAACPVPYFTDEEIGALLASPDIILQKFMAKHKLSLQIFEKLCREELMIPEAGYFLGTDNYATNHPQGEKNGIFVTKNLYLDVCVPTETMTIEQAKNFCQNNDCQMPSREAINLLLSKIDKVDYALDNCGKRDYRIFNKALDSCWYQEYVSPFPGEKRRLIIFRPYEGVDDIYATLMKLFHFLK